MWTAALRIFASTGGMSGVMNTATKAVSSFASTATSGIQKTLDVGNLAAKAYGSLTEAFFRATQQAKQFSNIASRMKISPAEVAALGEAAEETGVPLQALGRSIRDLQKLGSGGVTGNLNKGMKEASNLLGLNAQEFKTLSTGGTEALKLIAEKYKDIEDPARQFAVMQALHGRNAQFMGAIYERSGSELEDLFNNQITSSDEVIKKNKGIYDAVDRISDRWNVFLSWVISKLGIFVTMLDYISAGVSLVGSTLGRIGGIAEDTFDAMIDFGAGTWQSVFGMEDAAQESFDSVNEKFKKMGDSISDWWNKEVAGDFGGAFMRLANKVIPNFIQRLYKTKAEMKKMNFLEKAPEQEEAVVKANTKASEELEAAKKKHEWEIADGEQRKKLLAEELKLISEKELQTAREKFQTDEEARMKAMGKNWVVTDEDFKKSAAYLEIQKKLLEMKDKEVENEKTITKEKEEQAKKAAEAWKALDEEDKKKRELASEERKQKNELFDAQVELVRRDLDDSEASATAKAQFELQVQQEKMTRIKREQLVAADEISKAQALLDSAKDDETKKIAQERLDEAKKNFTTLSGEELQQALDVDAASREIKKANKADAEKALEGDTGGRGGTGNSLTAVGGGGTLALSPVDIAKSQLAVQQSIDTNIAAMRAKLDGGGSINIATQGYQSNQTPVPQ